MISDTEANLLRGFAPGRRFWRQGEDFDPGESAGNFRTRIFIAFEESPIRRLAAVVLKRRQFRRRAHALLGPVRVAAPDLHRTVVDELDEALCLR